ncbi:MAG TPA: HDIG domain-containing protein [Chloroflexia bacterium]|nr:HDIG domain-containing protein [Chloroflexia bacterium]
MFSRFSRKRESERSADPPLTERQFADNLLSSRPSDCIMRWAVQGRLRNLVPDLDALRGVSQLPAHRDDAFVHTLKVVDAIEPVPALRWAALFHDIGKGPTFIETPEGRSRFFEHDKMGAEIAAEILPNFVDDPSLVSKVVRMVRLHMRPISYNAEWSDSAVRRLCDDVEAGEGEAGWQHQMALARADLRGYLPEPIDRGLWVLDQLEAHRRRLMEVAAGAVSRTPPIPLDGHEILAIANLDPGPWVAEVKEHLLSEVEAGRLAREDKRQAAELAREWLRTHA